MSSTAATTTSSGSAGVRGLHKRPAALGSGANCSSMAAAALHGAYARPAAREATAARRATVTPAAARSAHLEPQRNGASSSTWQPAGAHALNQAQHSDAALQAAKAAAMQALQLAVQRSSHSGRPTQAAAAMQHMLRLAVSAASPSSDSAVLFTACVAPLLASGLLSPLDTAQLMGQSAAAQAQDFCFLLKAVAKAAGNPCDLSSWCLEASHPQAVLVFALWLMACAGCSDSALTSAAAGLGSAPAHAAELASQLLRRLGVALSPSSAAWASSPAPGIPAISTNAQVSIGSANARSALLQAGQSERETDFLWESNPQESSDDARGDGAGWLGSRTMPRVFCSSVQVQATGRSEGMVTLLGQEEDRQWEGEALSQRRNGGTAGASNGHDGLGSRKAAAAHEPGMAAAAGASTLSKTPGARLQGQQQQGGSQGQGLSAQGRARLRRPMHSTHDEDSDDPSTPMGPSDLGVGPMPPAQGWGTPINPYLMDEEEQQAPRQFVHPGHDRPPPTALRLAVDGPLGGTVSPLRLDMPVDGPWVVSNCRFAFPDSDVVLPLRGKRPGLTGIPLLAWQRSWQGAKLALRFEFIADRKEPGVAPVLHVFNLSRVLSGERKRHCWAYVNGRKLAPGDRGTPLAAGDVVVIGADPSRPLEYQKGSLRLVVQEVDEGQTRKSPIERALDWYGLRRVAPPAAGTPQDTPSLIRKLQTDVVKDPTNTSAWVALAQMSARNNRSFVTTRDLFRAALHSVGEYAASIKRQEEAEAAAVAAAVAAGVAAQPSATRHSAAAPAASTATAALRPRAASSEAPPPLSAGTDSVAPPPSLPITLRPSPLSPGNTPPPPFEPSTPPMGPSSSLASGWPLVRRRIQVLYHWAAAEWAGGSRGSARHLWRRAADLTYRHPSGANAGGHWRVMLAWAQAELDRDSVANARIILAEALRRTPSAQPLYVLGGAIELAAGNLELAKGFCARAYEMDRRDERLYVVWPKVEAALGERDRARVLFERGLEYHPRSLTLLEEYARFEASSGDVRQARELHERALDLEPDGVRTLSIRASYATLEMDEGRLPAARRILQEGRAVAPAADSHPQLLLAEARLERLSGNLEVARRLLENVDKKRGFFRTDVLRERVALLRAYGEVEMARALDAHLRATLRLQQVKREGANGWEAWRAFFADAGSAERQQLVAAARTRKMDLGLWSMADPALPGAAVAADAVAATGAEAGVEVDAGQVLAASSHQPSEAPGAMLHGAPFEEEEEGEGEVLAAVPRPVRRPRMPDELVRRERIVREQIFRDRRDRMEQRERQRAAAQAEAEARALAMEEGEQEEGEEEWGVEDDREDLGLPEVAWEEVEGAMAAAEQQEQQERLQQQQLLLEEEAEEEGEKHDEGEEEEKGRSGPRSGGQRRRQQQWQSVGKAADHRP